MTKGIATRVGNVTAGIVKQTENNEEINDPTPIVLWSDQGQTAAILYFSSETDAADRSGVQKISRIPAKGGAQAEKAGSGFGNDFPVVVKLKESSRKEAPPPDPIEARTIVNADVNGDGVDELVFARTLGDVSVYTTEKLLSQYTPRDFKPDKYAYEFLVPYKVGLKNSDVVFLVVNRNLSAPISGLSAGERDFHGKTENYHLFRVDGGGISTVRLQNPAWKIGRVAGVAATCGKGGKIEEMVAFCEKEGDPQLYLSRHTPDGAAIGVPRKVYVSLPGSLTLETFSAPDASRIVVASRHESLICFVAPEKAANWFHVLDLRKLLPGKEPTIPLRAVNSGTTTLALVRQGNQVYALDEEGRFYAGKGETLTRVSERKPCMRFVAGDGAHRLAEMLAPERSGNHLLVVETRDPGTRSLSDAEVIEAGKKFLSPAEYAMAERAGTIWFGDSEKEEARNIANRKGIAPQLDSLEDVRKLLPEYYESLRAESQSRFRKDLEGSLLRTNEIADKGQAVEEGRYRRKDEYLAWLKDVYREGELVLTAYSFGGEVLGKVTLAGYVYPETDTALWLERVNYRGRGDHGIAVMTLKKRTFTEDGSAGYYRIDW